MSFWSVSWTDPVGAPQDITLAELAVELFFPADATSEAMPREAAAAPPKILPAR